MVYSVICRYYELCGRHTWICYSDETISKSARWCSDLQSSDYDDDDFIAFHICEQLLARR